MIQVPEINQKQSGWREVGDLSGVARTASPPRGLRNSLEKENLSSDYSAQLNPTNISWAPTVCQAPF